MIAPGGSGTLCFLPPPLGPDCEGEVVPVHNRGDISCTGSAGVSPCTSHSQWGQSCRKGAILSWSGTWPEVGGQESDSDGPLNHQRAFTGEKLWHVKEVQYPVPAYQNLQGNNKKGTRYPDDFL